MVILIYAPNFMGGGLVAWSTLDMAPKVNKGTTWQSGSSNQHMKLKLDQVKKLPNYIALNLYNF